MSTSNWLLLAIFIILDNNGEVLLYIQLYIHVDVGLVFIVKRKSVFEN